MVSPCNYRSYGSKKLMSYFYAMDNGTLDSYHNSRGHLSLDKCLELVRDYLYNKYKARGYNFSFRSSTIKRDTGINATVIGKSLFHMFSDDYKGKVFASVIHRTTSNKKTVWKTNFGVKR